MPNDLPRVVWRKSRRSGEQGQCVEVGSLGNEIAVRDSKNPGPMLVVGRRAMTELAAQIKAGRLEA